jgi:hypothetical protein
MRRITACMHDALRNAFVVEMKDLLAEVEILQQRWSTRSDFQGVLIVGNRPTLSCRQNGRFARCSLMKFAAFPAVELLIVDSRRPRGCASRFFGLGHDAITSGGTD